MGAQVLVPGPGAIRGLLVTWAPLIETKVKWVVSVVTQHPETQMEPVDQLILLLSAGG